MILWQRENVSSKILDLWWWIVISVMGYSMGNFTDLKVMAGIDRMMARRGCCDELKFC